MSGMHRFYEQGTTQDDRASEGTLERSVYRLLWTGEYILVDIDDYSRYPEIETLHSTSARATIPKLGAIFARQ